MLTWTTMPSKASPGLTLARVDHNQVPEDTLSEWFDAFIRFATDNPSSFETSLLEDELKERFDKTWQMQNIGQAPNFLAIDETGQVQASYKRTNHFSPNLIKPDSIKSPVDVQKFLGRQLINSPESYGLNTSVYPSEIAHSFFIRVAPSYRRQGLAKEMMSKSFEELAAKGVKIVLSSYDADNIASAQLHNELGFEPVLDRETQVFQIEKPEGVKDSVTRFKILDPKLSPLDDNNWQLNSGSYNRLIAAAIYKAEELLDNLIEVSYLKPSFENTLYPLDLAKRIVDEAYRPIDCLSKTNNSGYEDEALSMAQSFYSRLDSDPLIYQRLLDLKESEAFNDLGFEQKRFLESRLHQMKLNQADIVEDDAENLEDEEISDFDLYTSNIEMIKEDLLQEELSFRKTLIQAASADKSVRASIIASNEDTIRKILELRLKLAQELGFESYLKMSESKGFMTEKEANAFIAEMKTSQLADFAREEAQSLQELNANKEVKPSERNKLFTKQASQVLEDLNPSDYFSWDKVFTKSLKLIGNFYGVEFKENKSRIQWHDHVVSYDVFDKDSGEPLGILNIDPFSRKGKRDGAWTWQVKFRSENLDGSVNQPVVNSHLPIDKENAENLEYDTVVSFFHEMGHAMHGLVSKAKISSQAGTEVALDFKEVPSYFMEELAYQPEVIKALSEHYVSGESLSDEEAQRIIALRKIAAGYKNMRTLAMAEFDRDLHASEKGHLNYKNKARRINSEYAETSPLLAKAIRPQQFKQIFQGILPCFHYSYLTGRVIGADMFSKLNKEDILRPGAGREFREKVLAKGDTIAAKEIIQDFLGRDFSTKPFLNVFQ